MPHRHRARRSTLRTTASLACTLATFAVAAESARAADAAQTTEGLHISTGALVDPDGRTWVADHNAGFCRVTDPTDGGPGQVEHPTHPDGLELRTCLGGLLPNAAPGPDAAGQPTFYDPSPEFADSGDELAFIPDGASPSSEVVRAKWNPATGRFAFLDTVTMNGDRGRPVATSLGPDDRIYVVFQRETTIQAITDLDAATPVARTVGRTSDGRGAAAVAATRGADGSTEVLVAESVGLRTLRPGTATTDTAPSPFAIDGPGGVPAAVSALASDLSRRVVWAGTADGATQADAGIDRLMRIDLDADAADAVSRRAGGFSMIGGLGVRPDGHVDVLDDPALLDPAEPLGTGRAFRVGLPVAHVTRGPLDDEGRELPGRDVTADRTPGFRVAGEGELECRFTGPGRAPAWGDCPADGVVEIGEPLDDGAYALAVRSRVGAVVGIPEVHRFRVDTTAPLPPSIKRPAAGAVVSGTPWYEIDAERGAALSCRFTEGAIDPENPPTADFEPCTAGRTRSFETAGERTLEVRATDRAGNVSLTSDPRTFTVDPDLPPTPPPGFEAGPPRYSGSSVFADGLHISAGAIVDPNGRTWVADHNGGFCRVTDPTEDGPGRIEHPELPTDLDTPRTCLGGLLPFAATGPDAAGQPTFVDPTPGQPGSGDENVLIPDGASHSSDVVRVQWNPGSGLFEYRDAVLMSNAGGRARPTATTLGPDGNVYVVFQREASIQQITSPAGANPRVRVAGRTADGRGAAAVAAARTDDNRTMVYVAETTGIRQFRVAPATSPLTEPAAVPGLGDPAVTGTVSAMVSDLGRNQLWIGTADAAGVTEPTPGADVVHRVSLADGRIDRAHTKGYTMVGGLGLRPDGVLFVLDDPALIDPAEPLGMGRMFHVGLPAAHVVRGPVQDDGSDVTKGATRDLTPAFAVETAEGVAECRVKGGETATEWAPCGTGLQEVGPLAEGSYRLLVRAVDGEVKGLVEARAFRIDRTAPGKPSILSPVAGLVPASPWFEFESEPGARFECRFEDDADFRACEPGRTRSFPENGDHSLRIRAIDAAGNVSVESDRLAFSTRNRVNAVRITAGPEGPTRDASPTFAFQADPADAVGVTYGCRLSGQVFTVCSSTRSYSQLADGTYHFEVRAQDAAGNQTPLVRRTFTVDRTAPVITLPGIQEGATLGAGARLAIATSEDATVRCSFDGGAFATCGPTVPLDALADGDHRLVIVATDAAGNERTLVRTFRIVRPAPVGPTTTAPAARAVGPATDPVAVTALRLAATIPAADREVAVAALQATGLRVTVTPPAGARVVRFRVFRVGGRAAAAGASAAKPMATVFRAAKGGRKQTLKLGHRELGRLRPGRYRLEMRAGSSRDRLGSAVTRTFSVTR